ncbi:N-acetylmuramoyl-L-alanine amidase [Clostridium botulinum]|uniref:N-acetylmuramoyl-L-alanine amidase n=2 Tax=Clostridium botulinum TaxID=1491 RepID=A0A3F2ZWP8_CLOB6|nr:N-acetylmuramoyl-L-alanine amidase [Clostridium botulinum]ACQ52855.1 putative N-acetylmuramoyl-L-alanine amidase [Clostridium botulinum Ba4 str. 657]AJE10248.1 N-acetylmuramoyl-L-alanine amidase family protein [Clostridium botulinum CDC_1436]EDT87182.1 putative N-acetylmuramoyl-L-alanine amidase [Clostridium botulinum Bf]MBY6881416.1 N-acetylmuramoyl-L-alanine amidase [Clostridium botulinum]WCJ72816.1 N-acetylmuramoyl-L-alanine amidase [Clostridium botulinum]
MEKIFLLKERRGNMYMGEIENIVKKIPLILLISIIVTFVPSFKVHASSTTPIMGQPQLTQEQALNYFKTRNSEKSDQATKEFISIVWQEANLEGIRADVVFIQIMKETNFLKFTGDVKECQNNFAGIGATGGGVPGAYFKDTRTGVRAVVQHLKAYCSTEGLKNPCVDPRFTYVQRGISPYVEWLGIGENPNYPDKGWAADNNYGKSIVEMMHSAKYLANEGDSQGNITTSKATINNLEVSLDGNNVVTNELEPGKAYNIKAYGNSSNGVLYEYWIKDLSINSWIKLRDYSTTNEVKWTPNKSGKYLIGVHVKDRYSKERLDNFKYVEYNVASLKKATISSLEVSLDGNNVVNNELEPGKAYNIKAYGNSSNGVLYEYWIKDLSINSWIKLRDYSTTNEVKWTSNKSGKYLIGVHVKDRYSEERLDNFKYVEYNVASPKKATVNSLEVSLDGNKVVTNELNPGKSYSIKAYGNSSNGVLYEYWIKDLSINSWIKLKDYSTSTQVAWTPNKPGKYLIGVHVKDKYSVQKLDNFKYVEYNVASPKKATINSLEVSLNGGKVVNNELQAGEIYNIKAYGSSSNGVLYEYWIKDLSINSWIKLKDYSTSTQVTWTPNKSGKYLIGVHVKDKYSTQKLDNFKYVEYNVKLSKKAVISNLEVSLNGKIVTNNQLNSGKTYSIKTYAESLNGVLYEYWIKDLSSNSWIKLKDYSTSTQITWTPNKAGKYLIGVHVKDKYSNERLDNYKYVEYSVQGSLIKTIVLDAGHGGRDSGAVSSRATGNIHEADIVQKITIKLGNLLKAKGYNVIYTRDKVDNYNYPSITQNLEDRINVANNIKADLFVSIHADSADSSSAHGYGAHYSSYRPRLDNSGVYMEDDVYYDRTPCDAALKSKVLSQLIVNEMASLGTTNRGIYDHNLYVTRNALMPSVLVECGFVSNDAEVRWLNTDSNQNKIAQKLYNAVTKLFSI